jgi:NAD(P)H dehydrogenase (quinone)
MSIVITGASGQLGRRVAELVLAQTDDVILATRTPDALAGLGGEVRHADFDHPAGLADAFRGATKLLLISLPVIGARVPQHQAAIEAAAAAGAGLIAYTSIVNPGPENASAVAAEHLATEEATRASGVPYTFLRNNIYADLQVPGARAALASGRLVTNAGDGRTGYVTREDCARVAAAVLLGEGHENQAYDVTGPAALNAADLAALYAEVGGKPVEVVHVDDEAYAEGLVEHAGMPPELAKTYATFGTATRSGVLDVVTDVVKTLTGREPGTVRDVLAAAL